MHHQFRSGLVMKAWAMALTLATGPIAQAADPIAAQPLVDPTPYVVGGGLENVQLSPDGTRMAGMVRTASGLRALVSRKVDGSDQRVAYHLKEPGMDLSLVRWLGNERFLLRVSNNQERVNNSLPLPITRLVVIDVDGGKPQVLTKPHQMGWTNHMSQEATPACSASTLVQIPALDEQGATLRLWRFDAQASRWLTPTNLPANSRRVFSDGKDQVRLVLRSTASTQPVQRMVLLELGGRWQPWQPRALPPELRARDLGVSADGRKAYVLVEPDGAKAELWRLAMDRDDAEPEKLMHVAHSAGPFELLRNAGSCEPVGLRGRGQTWAWGDGLDRLTGGIQAQLPDRSVELMDWQGDRYLVRIGSPTTPTEYLVGTRSTQQLQGVGGTHVRLPVELGLRWREIRLAGVPDSVGVLAPKDGKGPLPTILCIECQLDEDDRQGRFDGPRAYWARQGWAVIDASSLPISLRDTIRRTPEALQHWRRIVEGLVDLGVTKRGQVVVVALSNEAGRHALLLGAEPDGLVQGVVTLGALTDVPGYAEQYKNEISNADWRLRQDLSPGLSPAELRQRSPLHRAADQRAAVLLVHADHDSAIDPEQAHAMHRALQARRHASELLVLQNSTEQVDHPPDRIAVMKAIDGLLASLRAASSAGQNTPQ